MGHAEHDLAHAVGGGIADDRVEHRHQGIGALDREALLAEVGLMQEALEPLDLGQPLEQLLLRLGGEIRGVMAALDGLAQPGALLGDLDLIEVVADAAAVDAPQIVDRLLGVGGIGIDRPGHRLGRQGGELGVGDAVEGRVQLRRAVRRRAERIELDIEVTVVTDRLGQPGRADHGRDIIDRPRRRRVATGGAPVRGRAAASASTSAGSTRSNVALVSASTLVGILR